MSKPSGGHEPDSLFELLSALADERLTDAQADELVSRLRQDKQARAVYIEHAFVEAMLPRAVRRGDTAAALPGITGAEADQPAPSPGGTSPEKSTGESPILGFLGDCVQRSIPYAPGPVGFSVFIALVFCAFGAGWFWSGALPVDQDQDRASAEVRQAEVPVIVARLVNALDVRWAAGSSTPSRGAALELGTILEIDAGHIEIAFNSGAHVILEGPAKFGLNSELAGFLYGGSLAAEVPEEARGFVVETSSASIVDLGTKFGVKVDKRGVAEAFVFDGEVRIGASTDTFGDYAEQRVTTGQAVQIEPPHNGVPRIRNIGFPSSDFLLSVPEGDRPTTPLQIAGLRLWLKADAGTCRDPAGAIPANVGDPVACWVDQSGNSLSPVQPVLSYRPLLVVDSRSDRMLRFDGVAQRLEEPCTSGPRAQVLEPFDRGVRTQFTICLVFAANKSRCTKSQTLFGQFSGNTKVTDTSRHVGIGELGQFVYDEWPPGHMYLWSAEDAVRPGQTCIVVVTRDGNTRSIHFNGDLLVRDDEAETYAGNEPCHWWIGARYGWGKAIQFFQGDIAEIIIFTRALPDTARSEVEQYLKSKYF